jgi:hypothetical protein
VTHPHDTCAQRAQDRASITAGVILTIVGLALRDWFTGDPLNRDDLRARIADVIRDHGHDLTADLVRDLSIHPPSED